MKSFSQFIRESGGATKAEDPLKRRAELAQAQAKSLRRTWRIKRAKERWVKAQQALNDARKNLQKAMSEEENR